VVSSANVRLLLPGGGWTWYVGRTNNPERRDREHRGLRGYYDFHFERCTSSWQARRREKELIIELRSVYNIHHNPRYRWERSGRLMPRWMRHDIMETIHKKAHRK
jgi:hypothetical protein